MNVGRISSLSSKKYGHPLNINSLTLANTESVSVHNFICLAVTVGVARQSVSKTQSLLCTVEGTSGNGRQLKAPAWPSSFPA